MKRLGKINVRVVNVLEYSREIGAAHGLYHTLRAL